MRKLWASAVLAFLGWTGAAQASAGKEPPVTACVVVSGVLREGPIGPFGASHPWLAQSTVRVGGLNCPIVRSWKGIQSLEAQLPPGQPLLVLQGAHGQWDASRRTTRFLCDRETVSSSDALNLLETMAKRRPVAAALSTCYSGRMLVEKLVRDEQRSAHDAQLANLCLLTSSVFGRPSLVHGRDLISRLDERAGDGTTFNQFYLSALSGLSSAAPWSEAGIPRLLAPGASQAPESDVVRLARAFRRWGGASDLPAQRVASWAYFGSRLSLNSLAYLKQAPSLEQVKPLLKNGAEPQLLSRKQEWIEAILGTRLDHDFEPVEEPGSRRTMSSDDGFQTVSLPAAVVGFSRGGVLSSQRSRDAKDRARYTACQNFRIGS